MHNTHTTQGFGALNLPRSLTEQLKRIGIVHPTPIQSKAIPLALEGHDVIGIAQTGTGKTLAFGLPMILRLESDQTGLVIAPTRELAEQIEETFRKLNVKTALVIGGAGMHKQIAQLRSRPRIIIATPGRLLDHIDRRTVDLRRVSIAVLDEADRMLDMGFAPAIRKILDVVPRGRQTMLFSATMPPQIAELAERYQRNAKRVEVERPGTAAVTVQQELAVVAQPEKAGLLETLLTEHKGSVLIFARTRHGARKLAKALKARGHSTAEIHSDRTPAQRRMALLGFKKGQYRILVATDIAARGIDVKDISLVINYDMPQNPEDYVHRIGRTGRAGMEGRAITMATPEQHRDVRGIEKLLKAKLSLSSHSTTLTLEKPASHTARPKQANYGRPSNKHRSRFHSRRRRA